MAGWCGQAPDGADSAICTRHKGWHRAGQGGERGVKTDPLPRDPVGAEAVPGRQCAADLLEAGEGHRDLLRSFSES